MSGLWIKRREALDYFLELFLVQLEHQESNTRVFSETTVAPVYQENRNILDSLLCWTKVQLLSWVPLSNRILRPSTQNRKLSHLHRRTCQSQRISEKSSSGWTHFVLNRSIRLKFVDSLHISHAFHNNYPGKPDTVQHFLHTQVN